MLGDDLSRAGNTMRISIVMNPRSGRLSREGETLIAELRNHASVCRVDSLVEDGEDALKAALSSGADAIAIAGGDGTIRAVTAMAMRAGSARPLIPLPLGTANLLPRALYGERDALTILDEASRYQDHTLTGGELDGHLFLIAAAIGFPSTLARARESLREDRRDRPLAGAVRNALASVGQAFLPRLTCRFDDKPAPGRASGLYVTLETDPLHPALAGAPAVGDADNPCFAAVLTRWRHIGDLAAAPMDTMTRTDDPKARTRPIGFEVAEISSRKPLAAMIDGEPLTLGNSARITRLADPVHVLKPAESDRA
jgi:diacylglycerol kinase family enzyme